MTLSVSSQALVSGSFGSFTTVMAQTAGGQFLGSIAVLKNDESGLFDFTSLMPRSGGSVGISGTLPGFAATPAFSISGTLPAFAAIPTFSLNPGGTVGLAAGAAAIGSIIGRTSAPSVTPVITAAAYTAGQEVGGLMTFAVGGAGSGILESVRVTCKSIQQTALALYIFDINPTNTTWTDKSTPAINAADVASVRAVFTLSIASSGLGTHTIWNMDGIGCSFIGANLYGILVCLGTPTFASISDVTVKLGIVDD